MSGNLMYRILVILGFISLFHSAYSAAQHRSYLRLNELEFLGLPLDISIQAIISLYMIIFGILKVSGKFKEIKASAELDNKSWGTLRNIPSFYTFNHRGKSFSKFFHHTSNSQLDEVE